MAKKPEPPENNGTGKRSGQSAPSSGWNETAVLLARISGIGWFVAASIGLGAGGGWFLDRQFGTSPVLTLVGLGLGILIAFTGMIRLLSAIGRKSSNRKT